MPDAELDIAPPSAQEPPPAPGPACVYPDPAQRLDYYFQQLGNPALAEGKTTQEMIWFLIENERRRIGQDIHDGLCQQITGISFMVKALQEKLQSKDQPEAAEAVQINRLLQDAVTQARDLARGLYPVELETGGLATALEKLARMTEGLFPVSCRCDCPRSFPGLPAETALHLFRICQEAVANAVKHSQARSVLIRVTRDDRQLLLVIQDDGVGMNPLDAAGSGLGLRIMRHRAEMIHASLDIGRSDQSGTQVRCVLAIEGHP